MGESQKWYSISAGVGRRSIAPKVGLRLCGSLRDELSTAIHNEVLTSVVMFESRGERVVIVTIDAIIFSLDEAATIRTAVAKSTRVEADRVFLNISHTHAAPAPPSFSEFDPEDGEQWSDNRAYFGFLVEQTAAAAHDAAAKIQPVTIAMSEGEVQIGVNRREVLPDGTLALGENPNGPRDDRVGVVKVASHTGQTIATLVHYSCHPDILGPKSTLVSPDFIGPMRTFVEQSVGGYAMFIQGCCADVDPVVGIVVGDDGERETDRLGNLLGAEVVKILLCIGDRRVRDHRVYWKGQNSTVTGWAYEEATLETATVAVSNSSIDLPLRALPPLEECISFQQHAAQNWAAARVDTKRLLSDRLVARRRALWASIQLEAAQSGRELRVELPLQAVRVGPFVLVGIPAEVFVEIGQQIEERVRSLASSRGCRSFISGYTNGVYFYVPTASAFTAGGYEVDSHRNYLKPSGPTPEWERLLVEAGSALLESTLS
jgi:hypothetical protein